MPNFLAGPIILCIVSVVLFVGAYLIRKRGPRGLLNGVDWDRVSDSEALGKYASNLLYAMGLSMVAFSVAFYFAGDDKGSSDIIAISFAVCVALLALGLVIGITRYQDKPVITKHDGRR